jgi:hypothetical protein
LLCLAIRQALAKAIVTFYQKYVDEASKKEIKDILVKYDRTLLVADPRRCEPKKFGGQGARARYIFNLNLKNIIKNTNHNSILVTKNLTVKVYCYTRLVLLPSGGGMGPVNIIINSIYSFRQGGLLKSVLCNNYIIVYFRFYKYKYLNNFLAITMFILALIKIMACSFHYTIHQLNRSLHI